MPFQLDVGTDLFGAKFNTTLKFAEQPRDYETIVAAVESYFDTKSRAVRPAGYPDIPFRVESFQVFNDNQGQWVDLGVHDMYKLYNQQQVWCFQPESIWHSDAQGVIPNSEPGSVNFTWTTPLGSPRRRRVASDAGVPPTLSEKLRSVFYATDSRNKGYLSLDDLEHVFQRCEMKFTEKSALELFHFADLNRNKAVSYDEFVNFALRCPNVIDALFFRLRDMRTGAVPFESLRGSPAPHHSTHAHSAHAPPSVAGAGSPDSTGPPEVVRVRGGQNGCAGDFRIAETHWGNYPYWVNTESNRFLYSTPDGHWMITDRRENFENGCGWVTSVEPHHGRWPNEVAHWEQKAEAGPDPGLQIAQVRYVQTTQHGTPSPQPPVQRVVTQVVQQGAMPPPPPQQTAPQSVQTTVTHVQQQPQQFITSPPAPSPVPHQTVQYVYTSPAPDAAPAPAPAPAP
eukprot:Hpha_TRINITY_DN13513_c0_g1::TRINITY_DN13513_c0_g1_i1::g.111605::m.111605